MNPEGAVPIPQTPPPIASAPYTEPDRPKRKKWVAVVVVLSILAVVGSCCLWPFVFMLSTLDNDAFGDRNGVVAVIHIDAAISGVGGQDLLGTSSITPEFIIGLLRDADADPGIDAVLLRIDSPGGTVAASQEIALEVARMEKPVVASIGDLGASGAYWIASQCDYIVAVPGSMVGSIGVILSISNYEGLMELIGIETTVITRGEYKDAGSPYRSMTPEEVALFEQSMDVVYDQFIIGVAEGRGLSEEAVRDMATGWVWSGSEAIDMGLVDSLGNYADAILRAGELAGIEGEPEVVYYDEVEPLDLLMWLLTNVESLGGIVDGLGTGQSAIPVPR